tara:strand:- start:347 stop:1507 length:1161 start_codon:yes stop_codon:yes gene_type:complete
MNITKPRLDQFKITGSTVGDVHFPKVKALLPLNGSNGATSTTDESNTNATVTFQGSSTISTAQAKFGESSLYSPNANPAGVYITGAGGTIDLAGDFTIEWWFHRIQVSLSTNQMVGPIYGQASTTNPASKGLLIGYKSSSYSDQSALYCSTNGGSWNVASNVGLGTGSLGTVGQWVHMVMVRSGSDWSFYVDGTRTYNASLGSSTISAGGTNILLGKSWSTTSQMEGYWDDFRITVGLARYSGVSFTVPTTAHLTSAGDVNKHIVVNSDADGVAIGTGGINQARIAKAWADIDGTQAAASMIASSYNISSITDHGTGTYSFNFSTAMADADYSFSAGLGHIPSATAIGVVLAQEKTTALIKVRSRYESSGGNDYDYNTICIQVFGN